MLLCCLVGLSDQTKRYRDSYVPPACQTTSEAIFLECVLSSFHLHTLRRCSWVPTVVFPQYPETFNLIFYMEATELPSTEWQAEHNARAWLCLLPSLSSDNLKQ